MKYLKIIVILLFTSLSTLAADSSPLYWYQITIAVPSGYIPFTGSSSLDASQLATHVNGSEPIKLENLRECEMTNVSILPRTVLYYSELPGDPAVGKK